ncbi:hypothetical protein EDC04DRAFT_2606948 [Pisolithus marmoratus]|nr:hypothetical protein EDC04DRAFT_2606948 [Pisolithus marmoratus]
MDAPLVVLHQVLVYQNPHLVLEKGKMGMDHQLAQCPVEHLKHKQLQSPNGLCYKKITVETSESYYKWKTMVVNIYSQFSDTSLMADDQKMNMESPATSQEINYHITSTEAQSTIPTSLMQTGLKYCPYARNTSGCWHCLQLEGKCHSLIPYHACPSALSSVLLKSPVLKTAVSQGDNDAQHAPTSISDADQDGSEQEEAQFLLEVAQAQHLVCSIEQELAKVKLQENIALGSRVEAGNC